MMKRLLSLLSRESEPEPVDYMEFYFGEVDDGTLELKAESNDATRPSYRVGKHQSSDFFKAIDLSG